MNGIPKEVSLPVLRSVPDFSPGDTVKVHVNIVEGNRKRIQVFMGVVIARKGTGISETFTVRKISFGVGVERVFPLHCPTIDKIEIASRGKSVAQNYTICVHLRVGLPKSKRNAIFSCTQST